MSENNKCSVVKNCKYCKVENDNDTCEKCNLVKDLSKLATIESQSKDDVVISLLQGISDKLDRLIKLNTKPTTIIKG